MSSVTAAGHPPCSNLPAYPAAAPNLGHARRNATGPSRPDSIWTAAAPAASADHFRIQQIAAPNRPLEASLTTLP